MSYSRLGLVWVHVFECKSSKEVKAITETMSDRQASAAAAKSLLPRTDIDTYADPTGAEEDDADFAAHAPLANFHLTWVMRHACVSTALPFARLRSPSAIPRWCALFQPLLFFCFCFPVVLAAPLFACFSNGVGVHMCRYLGNTAVTQQEGEVPINQAVLALKDTIAAGRKQAVSGGAKPGAALAGTLVELVVSAEGVRTVDRATREVLHNVLIKAISCGPLFPFIFCRWH